MCNCVERARTLLRREHDNDELEIEGLAYSIGSENQPVDQFLTCCYSYRKRNKNGDFYKAKTKRSSIPLIIILSEGLEKWNFTEAVFTPRSMQTT